MDLKQKLLSDLKGAMKDKDALKVSTLRLISSEIKNKEIDLRNELGDDAIIALLTTQIKKRKEAASFYEKGGRAELKQKEEQEMAILQEYLPEAVGEDEVKARIEQVIAEVGAEGPKDMGKVMKVVIPEFKGKADGGLIQRLVGELLKS
jgi:uncharacterized protein YqeY